MQSLPGILPDGPRNPSNFVSYRANKWAQMLQGRSDAPLLRTPTLWKMPSRKGASSRLQIASDVLPPRKRMSSKIEITSGVPDERKSYAMPLQMQLSKASKKQTYLRPMWQISVRWNMFQRKRQRLSHVSWREIMRYLMKNKRKAHYTAGWQMCTGVAQR